MCVCFLQLTKPAVTADVQGKSSTADQVVHGVEESNGMAQSGEIDDNGNSHKKNRKRKVADATEECYGTTQNGEIDDLSNSHKKKRKRKRSEETEETTKDENGITKKKKKKRKEHSDEKADTVCEDNPVFSSKTVGKFIEVMLVIYK